MSAIFLPHAVNCGRFCFWRRQSVVFCLCIKYLRNCWTDLCQVHTEDVFCSSLRRIWRSKVKVARDKNRHFSTLAAACVQFMFGHHTTRKHEPLIRPMNMGSVYRAPVSTGHVGKMTMLSADTARAHGCLLDTRYLCSQAVDTAHQHWCHFEHPWTWSVVIAHAHS